MATCGQGLQCPHHRFDHASSAGSATGEAAPRQGTHPPGCQVTAGLAKTDWGGEIPRISGSVGLGRGPRICISNKSPADADPAGLGPLRFRKLLTPW